LVARNLREAYAAGMPVDERTIDAALFLSKKVRIDGEPNETGPFSGRAGQWRRIGYWCGE
jgi:hypothetical protein